MEVCVAVEPSTTSAKKHQVLERLFEECLRRGDWTFDNDDVKRVSQSVGFGNPFDATKADTIADLPARVRDAGYCVAHLGGGRHCFIPELRYWYHAFEAIGEDDVITWRYRKSLLNDLDTGESSVLSFVYNQHILHDFLYEDVVASPKLYIPTRSRCTLQYQVGNTSLNAENLQMEVDLVMEYQGVVTVLEAKSSFRQDFAVYQLLHPVKFYLSQSQKYGIPIKGINACYVLRSKLREKGERLPRTIVRLYLYEFPDPARMDSLRLMRKAEYQLVRR